MATCSTRFHLAGDLPFLDVDVDEDNRLYVDPRAIRLSANRSHYGTDAVRCLDSFLQTVTAAALSRDVRRRTRALTLLQNFPEPWETRLGMSASGFHGHGGAEEAGTRIWDALTTDLQALVNVGHLNQLEHLPLFVPGIDRDITSDITTRIIFEPLLRFTEKMIVRYPSLAGEGTITQDFQVWDARTRQWSTAQATVPVVDGKALVLVPRDWARPWLLMSSARFYDVSVLGYAQLEQAVVVKDKLLKTPKRKLKKQEALRRCRSTNVAVTMRAHDKGDDLIRIFARFVDAQHHFTDEDVA